MSDRYGRNDYNDPYHGSSSSRRGGGTSEPYPSGSRSGYGDSSTYAYGSSPSGYSDQLDENKHYKAGSQIHRDYNDYKATHKGADSSSSAYWRESKNRDRTAATHVDEQPRPTKKDRKEWADMKHRTFIKDDHQALEPLAHDSYSKFKQYVVDRFLDVWY